MTKSILCCVSILALVAAASPARSGERAADGIVLPTPVSPKASTKDDCEARIDKLDASQAEGEERLTEKYAVIDYCSSQYKNDKTIGSLVKECAKYVEQPVVKQQFAADCMLAAFNYANALYALKVGP